MGKFQSEYVLYGGRVKMVFNKQWHRYTVNNIPVPSVTNILKVRANPALEGWAVKMTAQYFAPILETGIAPCTKSQIVEILKSAKAYRFEVSKEATDIGKDFHDWAEEYINHKIAEEDNVPKLPENEISVRCIDAFLEWEKENDVVYLSSERKIYSEKYNYAGTLDVECLVNGALTLLDFKTSNGIYESYYIQLASYVAAREEEGSEPFEQILVLRVPKDGSEFEVGLISNRDDIDYLFKVFRACLYLYNFNEGFKLEQKIKSKIKKLSVKTEQQPSNPE